MRPSVVPRLAALPLGPLLGPELVTNGGFDADTDWTKTTGWTISGGKAHSDNAGGAFNPLYQFVGTVTGRTYHVKLDVPDYTSGTVVVHLADGASGPDITAAGSYAFDIVASGDYILIYTWNGFVGSIDNISVKQLG